MKILLFILLCFISCSAFAASLITEYKFDASLIDTGSDGDVADTLAISADYADGISGPALLCSANNLSAPDSADLDLSGQYTIEAFIKPYSFTGIQYIFNKSSYALAVSDGNMIFYHTQSNGTILSSSPVGLTLKRWQHIAIIADGYTIMIFLNGRPAASFLYDGTIFNSALPLSIGSYAGSNPYNGLIDELRIFKEAKTPAYVYSRAFYNCGSVQKQDVDGDCKISFHDFSTIADQWLLSEN